MEHYYSKSKSCFAPARAVASPSPPFPKAVVCNLNISHLYESKRFLTHSRLHLSNAKFNVQYIPRAYTVKQSFARELVLQIISVFYLKRKTHLTHAITVLPNPTPIPVGTNFSNHQRYLVCQRTIYIFTINRIPPQLHSSSHHPLPPSTPTPPVPTPSCPNHDSHRFHNLRPPPLPHPLCSKALPAETNRPAGRPGQTVDRHPHACVRRPGRTGDRVVPVVLAGSPGEAAAGLP